MNRCSIVMVLFLLAGCSAEEAGGFRVHFGWQDGIEPNFEQTPLFLWASVQVWPDGELEQATTVAEAGPVRFGSAQTLEFSDLTYGDDRVVLAEVRASDMDTDPVRFFGHSRTFSIKPGRESNVDVDLHLGPAPGYDPQGEQVAADVRFFRGDEEIMVTAEPRVGLQMLLTSAEQVTVANDSAFSFGVATLSIDQLDSKDKGYYAWPDDWNLNQGRGPEYAAEDGLRSVYVRSSNRFGHTSPTSHASLGLDRTAPVVVLATLLRTPYFARAVDKELNEVYFGPEDPFTGIQVQATVLVYADEDFEHSSVWAVHQTAANTTINFVLETVEGEQSATYVWPVTTDASEGVYDLWIEWSDLLGNQAQALLDPKLRLAHASHTAVVVDGAEIHYTRVPFGSDSYDGAQNYNVYGNDGAITVGDDAAVHVMAYSRLESPGPATLIGYDLDPTEDGAFVIDELAAGDLPLVWIAGVDRYGLVGTPAAAVNSEWVATMGYKVQNSSVPNPLVYTACPAFSPRIGQRPDLTREPDNPSLLATSGGGMLRTNGAGIWRAHSDTGGNPPGVFGHAAEYNCADDTLVFFGGLIREDFVLHPFDRTWLFDSVLSSWYDITPAGLNPLPSASQTMVYDRRRNRLVMFGANPVTNLLWEFDPDRRSWSQLQPSGSLPPERSNQGMVYDSRRGQVMVLFGREPNQGTELDDLWIWTPSTGPGPGSWEEVAAASPWPSARYDPAVVYDHARDRVVMFGGLVGEDPVLELWEWNPEAREWAPLELLGIQDGVVPDHLETFDMVYDTHNHDIYLLGSFCERPDPEGPCSFAFNHGQELWKLDNENGMFALMSVVEFDPAIETVYRREFQLVFDEARSELIVFGGEDWWPGATESPLSYQLQAWRVDDGYWLDRTPSDTLPQARWLQAAAMSTSGKLLVFGGVVPPFAELYDTWTWDPLSETWESLDLPDFPDGDRSASAMVYVPATGSFLLFGGYYSDTPTSDMWVFDPNQVDWSPSFPASGTPPVRSKASMVWDQDAERVLLFGGISNTKNLQDTWEWDPNVNEWEERHPPVMPAARFQAAMAWAPGQVVLFGGEQGGMDPPLNDLWLWDSDPGEWIEVPKSDPWPPAGIFYQLVYEKSRHRMILLGGDEFWSLDPGSWTWQPLETTGDAPMGRMGHSLLYDESGGRAMLFGGYGHAGNLNDLWSLEQGLPAHLLEIPIDQVNIPANALVKRLEVTVVGGGTFTMELGGTTVDGVSLYLWENGRWRWKADNQGSPDNPVKLGFEITEADILELQPFKEGLSLHLAVTPKTGLQLENSQSTIAVDYAEVTVEYQLQP